MKQLESLQKGSIPGIEGAGGLLQRQGTNELMLETKEKFTIEVTDTGLDIFCGKERALCCTASEALMLLDILKNEETKLKRMAEEASPFPIGIDI